MNNGDPISSLAKAMMSALLKDLSDIEYEYIVDRKTKKKGKKKRRPQDYEVDVTHFQEMWSSTALGFGGWGGCAMTKAYSTIVIYNKEACVYFAGQFAYRCEANQALMDCLKSRSMPNVEDAKKKLILI